MATATKWTERLVRVDEIEVSMGLQMRVSEPPSEEYEEILRRQRGEWPFPRLRVIVVAGESGDRLLLVEGFTRLRAAIDAGRTKVPIECRPGAWEDAIAEACASNAEHGFRRTAADKRRAIIRAYEELTQSPTKIASICKVARTTVYAVVEGLRGEEVSDSVDASVTTQRAKSASPDPQRAERDSQSEITDECNVCGNVSWQATDAGYVCSVCQQSYEEVAAMGDDESEERATRRELIEEGVARDLAEAKSAYGKLYRALENAGLGDATERPMLQIHKKIEDSILSARRR